MNSTMVGMMNGDDPYSFESQLESFRRSDQARETLFYVRCYLYANFRHERCGRGYADCQDRKLFDNMTNLSKLIKRSAMTSKMRSRLADTGKTSTIL